VSPLASILSFSGSGRARPVPSRAAIESFSVADANQITIDGEAHVKAQADRGIEVRNHEGAPSD
jgi:hypothetical protein